MEGPSNMRKQEDRAFDETSARLEKAAEKSQSAESSSKTIELGAGSTIEYDAAKNFGAFVDSDGTRVEFYIHPTGLPQINTSFDDSVSIRSDTDPETVRGYFNRIDKIFRDGLLQSDEYRTIEERTQTTEGSPKEETQPSRESLRLVQSAEQFSKRHPKDD